MNDGACLFFILFGVPLACVAAGVLLGYLLWA